jgi:hypothetical protein
MLMTNSTPAVARSWIMAGTKTGTGIGVSADAGTLEFAAARRARALFRSAVPAPRLVVNQSHPPRDVLR